ncbi:hypothetical protein QML40_11090, partial [Aerococcus urinaeequi]
MNPYTHLTMNERETIFLMYEQDLELRKQRYHCRECNSYFTAKSEIVGDNCFISKRVKRMVLDFATNALTLKHIAETC